MQLSGAYVDGVDFAGTALQQAIGESARRRADVSADLAGDVDTESVESGFQLLAAAADKFRRFPSSRIAASGRTRWPALSIFCSSASTSPAMIIAWAFSRDSASLARPAERSIRWLVFMRTDSHAAERLTMRLGQFAQTAGAVPEKPQRGLRGFEMLRPPAGAIPRRRKEQGKSPSVAAHLCRASCPATPGVPSMSRMSSTIWNARPMCSPYSLKASNSLRLRSAVDGAHAGRGADHRAGFRAMNVVELLFLEGLAFGFQVGDLSADHSFDGARCARQLGDQFDAPLGGNRKLRQHEKGQRQQGIAGKNRHRIAEDFVAGRLAAPEVVVVERRQIVMNQRVGVDQFERAGAGLDACEPLATIHSQPSRRPRCTARAGCACLPRTGCSAWRDGWSQDTRRQAGPGAPKPPRCAGRGRPGIRRASRFPFTVLQTRTARLRSGPLS